jgi:hypothetical protein
MKKWILNKIIMSFIITRPYTENKFFNDINSKIINISN